MASTFECLGFALEGPDDLPALLDALRPASVFEGRFGGVDLRGWEDASSGARVSFGERDGVLEFLMPSLAAPVSARLTALEARAPEVFGASVLDADGRACASLTFELEEGHLLRDARLTASDVVDAAVVAFGNSVTVSPAQESADSGASPSLQPAGDAVAAAMVTGVVVGSETRVNAMTGRSFHVVPVRIAGWQLTLCLSASEFAEAPSAGDVVSGSSFVVVSFPSLRAPRAMRGARSASSVAAAPGHKRWWRR